MKRSIEGHYIRNTNGTRMPKYILVMDTETEYEQVGNEQHHKMKIAWSVLAHIGSDGKPTIETWRYWSKRYQLCEYIDNMAELMGELLIVGNNIFFDLQVCGFFRTLPDMGWKLDFFYENGLTYILCIKKGRLKIRCISLTNYFEASVKSLGDMIGKPKYEITFGEETPDELSIYCFRDTEIAYESLLEYLQYIISNDLGTFAMTRASQAMKAFKHRFISHKIMYHTNKELCEIEKDAYFGGRTECYQIGKINGGPFVDLDVNSLYPYIMMSKPVPIKPIDYYKSIPIRHIDDLLSSYGMIARVEIETDEPRYPYRNNGKLIFPVGRFTTTLCTENISYAHKHGHLISVSEAITYEMAYPFIDYINYFYRIRLEAKKTGNKVYDKMAKLLMNSLYGKFAAQRDITILTKPCEVTDYIREEVYDSVTNENQIISKLFGTLIITQGKEVIPGSIISIPAHITEYARNYLWLIMQKIGIENVYYCDTDSIKIQESNMYKLSDIIDPDKLGMLKVESKYSSLTINAAKDYVTDEARRLKGVPRNAEKIDDNTWKYSQFSRQITHMREHNNEYFKVSQVTKHLSRIYTKGKVGKDGRVTPFTLPDDLL